MPRKNPALCAPYNTCLTGAPHPLALAHCIRSSFRFDGSRFLVNAM
jgi:hypothetical protein